MLDIVLNVEKLFEKFISVYLIENKQLMSLC